LPTVTLPTATPGAVRPQTRMSYSSLSAYYKTSATSGIVAAPTPIVKLTGTSACQTTASCIRTADEVKTTIAYGSAGVANNLLATASSSGSGNGALTATVAQSYDMFGNPLTVDGALPGADDTMRTRYDAALRPLGTVGPDHDGAGPLKHRAQRMTYNGDGNVTNNGDGNVTKVESGTVNSQSDADWAAFAPLETAEGTFDTHGRKLTERLTSGGTTHALVQYSYDAKVRLECTAQRMNPAAYGSLPASACTLGAQGSFGPDRISKSLFDSADQVTKVQSALGTPDQADDVTSSYRLNGQAETVTDAENNRTTYEYDGHDRLKKTRFPMAAKGALASSTTDYEELSYDAGSNVVSRRLRDGKVIGYGYDALSRMTSKDLPNTATFEQDASYGYDLLGRLTATSDTLGHQQSYGYDALGRQLSDASNWYGTVSSQYDVAGRRTRLTWRDGFYVTYEHLVTGEMSAIRENGSFVLASFGYDDLGRRTLLSRGNGTATTYGYDAASRLSSLTQDLGGTAYDQILTFAYTPASQIASDTRSNDAYAWAQHSNVTRGYTANGLNQYTAAGPLTPAYDGRGNTTALGSASYGYTAENRLTSAPGNNLYSDPVGRLYHLSGSSTNLGYDGADVIEETQSSGGPSRRYVHGPGGRRAAGLVRRLRHRRPPLAPRRRAHR
jgi:YD repeat-containing protein